MTISKLLTEEALNAAYEELKNFDKTFRTVVNKVSVEMIGENEESIIVAEEILE